MPGTPVGSEDAVSLLQRLPPVTKAALRRHFPTGVVTGGPAEDWRYLSTAGTTDRMTVISDFPKRDQRAAASCARPCWISLGGDVERCPTVEIPPNACNVVCGLVDTGPQTFLGYLLHVLRQGKMFTSEARTELRGRFERQVLLRLHTLPPLEPMPGGPLNASTGCLPATRSPVCGRGCCAAYLSTCSGWPTSIRTPANRCPPSRPSAPLADCLLPP